MLSFLVFWFAHSFLSAPALQHPVIEIVCSAWNYDAPKTKWDIVGYPSTGGDPVTLVAGPESEVHPFLFPGEGAFGYFVEQGEKVVLWKYDLATGQSSDMGITIDRRVTCQVSPDGKRLACADVIDQRYQIVVFDLATKRREVITTHATDSFDPSWSPDGKRLVYFLRDAQKIRVGGQLMARRDKLAIYDFETKTHRLLINEPNVRDQYGRWSPDGRWIAFSREGKRAWSIWVVRPDGTEAAEVTTGARDDNFPNWSADSKTIVFQSYRSGNGDYLDIYRVDLATKVVTRVSNTGRIDEQRPLFVGR